jgi:Uma2 family endonuclease
MVLAMVPSIPRLRQPLTVTDFTALDELSCHFELQEGSLVLAPGPTRRHVIAVRALAGQFDAHMPDHLEVLTEIDLDLELARPDQPGFVRRPDLIVGDGLAFEAAEDNGRLMRASDVLLAVELVSPGSRRLDYKVKRAEYADAGIPHYWIVDLDSPISLLACELTETSGYVDTGEVTGTFITTQPFSMKIDLENLVRRRAGG